MTRSLTVVDLFAGAGGFSTGAYLAGARVGASVEFDAVACQTLRANSTYHGEVVEGDVCNITGQQLRAFSKLKARDPLIIVGGPPCQPFSKAAYWIEAGQEAEYRRMRAQGVAVDRPEAPTLAREDARRNLVGEYLRLVLESKAEGFVFENVPSLKHPRNRPVYEAFVNSAKAAGFEITEHTANAASYGVAQTRERVIVLGSKRKKPILPAETHYLDDDAGSLFMKKAVGAGEALADLDGDQFFEPEEVVTGRWAQHLLEVPPGWNYKAHTAWAGHPNPTFVTETRFWNFLLKLSPDRPSWTLAAQPGPWTGPFHWKSRRLRTAEMAALQGFPRGYKVEGSRRERVRQMGNAIPVPLAQVMVQSVLESLDR